MFYPQHHPIPNTQLSIDFWYHICGVSAETAGWGIKTVLTSDVSHVVSSYHASDQLTESRTSHDLNSMLKLNWTSNQTQENSYSLSSH